MSFSIMYIGSIFFTIPKIENVYVNNVPGLLSAFVRWGSDIFMT